MSEKGLKNTLVTLTVESVSGNGNGISHLPDGKCVFVTGGAAGDTARVRIIKDTKSYCVGKIEEFINPSSQRIADGCPYGGKCGGCAFPHIGYEYEVAFKKKHIEDCLERIGGIPLRLSAFHAAESIVGYRNKAIYPVGKSKDGKMIFGFYAANTHRLVEHDNCLIGNPAFTDVCKDIVAFCTENAVTPYDELSGNGLLRGIYLRSSTGGEMLLTLIINGKSFVSEDIENRFCDYIRGKHERVCGVVLNINTENTNAVLSDEWRTVCGDGFLYEVLCGNSFRISPAAFFQVNHAQTEVLYSEAARLAELKSGDTLLDLYCGTGTIGICLATKCNSGSLRDTGIKMAQNTAKHKNDGAALDEKGVAKAEASSCRLVGVEVSKEATVDAAFNAKANGISAEFICLDADEALDSPRVKDISPDVVILDPPRKGCGLPAVQRICALNSPRIVYISCDPATLARDLAEFSRLGYTPKEAVGVDMFPRTGHVECVCLMTKSK